MFTTFQCKSPKSLESTIKSWEYPNPYTIRLHHEHAAEVWAVWLRENDEIGRFAASSRRPVAVRHRPTQIPQLPFEFWIRLSSCFFNSSKILLAVSKLYSSNAQMNLCGSNSIISTWKRQLARVTTEMHWIKFTNRSFSEFASMLVITFRNDAYFRSNLFHQLPRMHTLLLARWK